MLERVRNGFRGGRRRPQVLEDIALRPIGVVRNRVTSTDSRDWRQVGSTIILEPELAPALLGLDSYSHIVVLSWLHGIPPDVRGSKLQLHPRDDPKNPLQGILATRSQIRPNPIAIACVRLLGIRDNEIRVRGLDVIDGTPVLDIKPYLPPFDSIPVATMPAWAAGERA